MERLSCLPFEQYSQRALLAPLGMEHTAWLFRDVDKSRMAMPYRHNWLRRRFEPIGFYGYPTYPDGSLKNQR